MEEDKDFISLELPMELSVKARTEAGKLNISRSEFVRQAIEYYLEIVKQRNNESGRELAR